MGNSQTSKDNIKSKDLKQINKNSMESLQPVSSCGSISDYKTDCIVEKRQKLKYSIENTDGKNIIANPIKNDYSLDISVNNGKFSKLDKSNQNGSKVKNGSTCKCFTGKKRCLTCRDSSPILLDGDDSATSNADNCQSDSSDKLFDYPNLQQTCRLTIYKHDIKCLQPVEYLNDVIIDFYLKYINYNLLNKMERENIHIFSSFFYSRLINSQNSSRTKKSSIVIQCPAVQRHNRIANWTRNIDIFDKDFLLIPINQHHHWFLAIICYPRKCIELFEEFKDKLDDDKFNEELNTHLSNQTKRPCILIFDSLCPNPERWDVSTILREYLQVEWDLRKNSTEGSKIFIKKFMRGNSVKCPQQANSYDCGCYLLLYAEYFFTKPIKVFSLPIRCCERWFSTAEASRMRDKLKKIIHELTIKYKKNIM